MFCPYLGEPGWEQKWATELEQVLALAMTSPAYIPPNANASPFEIADWSVKDAFAESNWQEKVRKRIRTEVREGSSGGFGEKA